MKFSLRKTKSKKFCSVFGCKSKACKNPEIRFHFFPAPNANFVKMINKFGIEEKVDRRKEWEKVLKMGKTVTSNMCVCSLYFKGYDYIASTSKYNYKFLFFSKGL